MSILEQTVRSIGEPDARAMKLASARQDELTKPRGSLGVLEELSVKIAGITGRLDPPLSKKAVFVMAGDHGIVSEGVSLYPQEVTRQMILNFLSGGAGINVIARHAGIRVVVADMGIKEPLESRNGLYIKRIGPGTRNMVREKAMTADEAVRSVEAGIEVFEAEFSKGLSIAGTGDMGIGNTTSSSAITAVFTGRPAIDVTGRGTGLSDSQLAEKISTIESILSFHRPDPKTGLTFFQRSRIEIAEQV